VPNPSFFALLVVSLCVAGCLSPRSQEARELLGDIAAGDGPSRLKETTPEASRVTIGYRHATGPAIADVYRSPAVPRGAVVVVPGLTPDGKDDPRLVAFAKSLARARFLVLVPDIANTRALKVSAADSAFIGDAIEELAQRVAGGGEPSVGLVAISYAVGPALLAASQVPAGRHLRFIVAIGGYYDIEAAIDFVTTGYYRAPTARGGTPLRTNGANGSSFAAMPTGWPIPAMASGCAGSPSGGWQIRRLKSATSPPGSGRTARRIRFGHQQRSRAGAGADRTIADGDPGRVAAPRPQGPRFPSDRWAGVPDPWPRRCDHSL